MERLEKLLLVGVTNGICKLSKYCIFLPRYLICLHFINRVIRIADLFCRAILRNISSSLRSFLEEMLIFENYSGIEHIYTVGELFQFGN